MADTPKTAASPASPGSPAGTPATPAGGIPVSPGAVPPPGTSSIGYPQMLRSEFSTTDGLSIERGPLRIRLEPQSRNALFDAIWGLIFALGGMYLAINAAHWNDWAWVAPAAFLLLVAVIFLILAPIHAVRGLEAISLHPEKFTGRVVAVVGGVVGTLLLLATLWQGTVQFISRVPEYKADNTPDQMTRLVQNFLHRAKGSTIDVHFYRQAQGHAFTTTNGVRLDVSAPDGMFTLPAGTCLLSPRSNGGTPVKKACDSWHQAEIVGTVPVVQPNLPEGDVSNATLTTCSKMLMVYLGGTDPSVSALQVAVAAPNTTQFAKGNHGAVCMGVSPVEFKGTIKNLQH